MQIAQVSSNDPGQELNCGPVAGGMRPVNNVHPTKSSFMHEVGLTMRYALGVEGLVAKGSIIVAYVTFS